MALRRFPGRSTALWTIILIGQIGMILALGVGRVPATAGQSPYGVNQSMDSAQMASMRTPAAKPQPVTVLLHRRVVRVTIQYFAFHPAQIVVSPGTRIIWTNKDSDPHTVDSTKNVWSSEALDTSGQFARVFGKAGAFPYYCSIHPFMHGSITVKK